MLRGARRCDVNYRWKGEMFSVEMMDDAVEPVVKMPEARTRPAFCVSGRKTRLGQSPYACHKSVSAAVAETVTPFEINRVTFSVIMVRLITRWAT